MYSIIEKLKAKNYSNENEKSIYSDFNIAKSLVRYAFTKDAILQYSDIA